MWIIEGRGTLESEQGSKVSPSLNRVVPHRFRFSGAEMTLGISLLFSITHDES